MPQHSSRNCKPRRGAISTYVVRVLALLWIAIFSIFIPKLTAQNPSSSRVEFTNVTAAAGIKFKHFKGNNGISINREEFGPGVCVADFDGDGWQDIYFVNGRDLYDRGISV